ncbi:unnamed protein product, partial [Urochloa humidicola]
EATASAASHSAARPSAHPAAASSTCIILAAAWGTAVATVPGHSNEGQLSLPRALASGHPARAARSERNFFGVF